MPQTSPVRQYLSSGFAAQAAYAFFNLATPSTALTRDGQGDFSSTEAGRFLGTQLGDGSGFQLLHHEPNDASSGFSASTFFDRSSNKYILGIRGTEGSLQDILEDISRIGFQGFAGDQLVSLYRYYRKLTTPANQAVQYSDSEMSLLKDIQLGIGTNLLSQLLNAGATAKLRGELAQDKGLPVPELPGFGPSVLPLGAPLIVTGHSLGGHLALLFGRLFPEVTEHVYTFNAPGIGPQGELMLRAMGIPQISSSSVTNISAVMGREAISTLPNLLTKPGEQIGIATEAGGAFHQHSIVPLTDTLALYDAFVVLSPGLMNGGADIGKMIAAASPYPENSVELTLDALRRAVTGSTVAPTPIAATTGDRDAREAYFASLYAMLDDRLAGRDYQIESLVGKSIQELSAMASSDVSVRYALSKLNAFAAKNADYSEFEDIYSGQWQASRAELLEAKLAGNLVERPFGLSGTTDNVLFHDVDMDLRYSKLNGVQGNLGIPIAGMADRGRILTFLAEVAYSRTVVFGSELLDDQLIGLAGGDRLFGGNGNDRLVGAGGEDYLEGGDGIDTLVGGDDDDTLVGGEDGDEDLLAGGPGHDKYIFGADLDVDKILDRDGSIYAENVLLTGGFGEKDSGVFTSSDGQFTYRFGPDLAAEGTLVINDVLRVEHFQNGDLGIRLVEGIDPELQVSAPATQVDLLGDFEHDAVEIAPNQYVFRDEFGNYLPLARVREFPGRNDLYTEFAGTPGNTHFVMGAGNDSVQDALGGDDHIELGSGEDVGFGGSGNDLIEGGEGRDVVVGGRGNDVLFARSAATIEADLDDDASGVLAGPGDILSGGDGDDTIVGDAEVNLIEGGTGKDRIFGGAGNDWIDADNTGLSSDEMYGVPAGSGGYFFLPTIDMLRGLTAGSNFEQFVLQFNSNRGGTDDGESDQVDAGAGNDLIFSGGGDDFIEGGTGNDQIHAGTGDDVIDGGAGDDQIRAGDGKDTIYGGDGNDFVWGAFDGVGDYIDTGSGDDHVSGGDGDDFFVGGDGDDTFSPLGDIAQGDDVLIGGGGNDSLLAMGNNVLIDGGPGNDVMGNALASGSTRFLFGRGYGLDAGIPFGGAAILEMIGDISPAEVTVSAGERIFPTGDGELALRGVEFSIGEGADSFFIFDFLPELGGAPFSRSVLFSDGTEWNDAFIDALLAAPEEPEYPSDFTGTNGSDVVYGTSGADTLSGGEGDDLLAGDLGDDVYLYAEGDGFDQIDDIDSTPGNTDVLRFADGIDTDDITVYSIEDDFVLESDSGAVRLVGGRTSEGAIERVEFADGSVWSSIDLGSRAISLPDNRAPSLPASFGSFTLDPGEALEIVLPDGVITDPDQFDSLNLFAITADGERLPGWLHFDATSRTFSGTPGQAQAGSHELLIIAADSSGAAAAASLTIQVGDAAPGPDPLPGTPPGSQGPIEQPLPTFQPANFASTPALSFDTPVAAEMAPPPPLPAPRALRENAFSESESAYVPVSQPPAFAESADPAFRAVQHTLDDLVQTGRTNLGERYAEAIREFEERRLQREEAPQPPPTDEEVEAWNAAMHSWHDRHPGFAEIDLGGSDGSWGTGWGLPATAETGFGATTASSLPGLANPISTARLQGAASAPALSDGFTPVR